MGLTNQQLQQTTESINRKEYQSFYKWQTVTYELEQASERVGAAIHHLKNAATILNEGDLRKRNMVSRLKAQAMVTTLASFAKGLRSFLKTARGFQDIADAPVKPSKV